MKAEGKSAAVRNLLERAEESARERGGSEVTSLDLLLALVRSPTGHLASIFERHQVRPEPIEAAIRERHGRGDGGKKAPSGPLAPAADLASAVARAGRAAESLGRDRFEPEDVLVALLTDRGSEATEVLRSRFQLTRDGLVEDLAKLRGQERAIAKAEGTHDCPHAPFEPEDAPTGLAAELRDLEARHRALCENVNAMRAREEALIAVVRRLWIAMLLVFAIIAGGVLAALFRLAR